MASVSAPSARAAEVKSRASVASWSGAGRGGSDGGVATRVPAPRRVRISFAASSSRYLDAVAERIPHEVSHSRIHGLAVVPAGYQSAADRCKAHEADNAAHALLSPEADRQDDPDRSVTDIPADHLAQ